MNEIFSDYLLRLGSDGEPPDSVSYEAVREELRTLAVGLLHRRGLWRAPPSHLGLVGSNWSETLDELVTEAYTFIFLHRLTGLKNQQKLKDNIRPLIQLNLGHLLTELQKKADPLGYRLFGRLRDAVVAAIDQGQLFAFGLDPKERIRNETVISFQNKVAPVTSNQGLETSVRSWANELLPDLVTAEGRAVPGVVARLSEKVLTLAEGGVVAFRFGDLITLLKSDVRQRWQGFWRGTFSDLALEEGGSEASPQPIQVVQANEEPDWARRFVLIQDCVATSIDGARPAKNRQDLWSLWALLRGTRVLPDEQGPLPALTEIGEQLKLTRDRVRQLFKRLVPIVQSCLQTAGRRPVAAPRRDELVAERGRR